MSEGGSEAPRLERSDDGTIRTITSVLPMFIPSSIWKDDVLHLPVDLNEVYRQKLEELQLLDAARQFDGRSPGHGGASQAETHQHFAQIYLNSSSRVQYVALDPTSAFGQISKDLALTFSSHRVSILDIPCGAGAGGIALLTTIKELRQADVIPTTPLSVDIFAADISPHALEIYRTQIEWLKPRLESAGITVNIDCRRWDAADLVATNDLLEDYLRHPSNEYFVLMANFSGAGKSHFSSFKPSFEQLFLRLSYHKLTGVTLLWVEPNSRSGKTQIQKLKDLIAGFVRFISGVSAGVDCISRDYTWYSCIQSKTVGSDVAVHNYKRDNKP